MNPKWPSSSSKSATLSVLGGIRDQLRDRRQARISYYALQRELAAYRTPNEIADLLAAVDRQVDAPEAERVRTILEDNLSAYRRRARRLAS